MQDFLDFARTNGFDISKPYLDGKIHRVKRNSKKDNAWYIGWHNATGSGETSFAKLGDWATGETFEFKPGGKKLTPEEKKQLKAKVAEAREAEAKEKEARQTEAAKYAAILLKQAQDETASPYLTKKKIDCIQGIKTLKEESGPVLLIPMRDGQTELVGLQKIYADGTKRFLFGQKTQETFYIIGTGGKLPDSEAYLCEGFATGVSIYLATKKPVICAFNAGNLLPVAKLLKRLKPSLYIIVAGDDDRFTESGNVGRDKAQAAADFLGTKTVFPSFRDLDTKPTDFNDLHALEGLEAVRRLLTITEDTKDETGFKPLGYDESTHFFYAIKDRNVVRFTTFTDVQFFSLMPQSYWENLYGTERGGINWVVAKNDLIAMSKASGIFNSAVVRGSGVWLDDHRVIVNTGRRLLLNNKPVGVTDLKTQFVYVRTKNKMHDLHPEPLTADEATLLYTIAKDLKWDAPRSAVLLAGWLAVARIAGALPIRPHVWLTGESASGKSTVMDRFIAPALGYHSSKLYLQGSSTEAGIRQAIKADSLPVIFDEFETTGEGSKIRIAALIELFRQSWSQTSGYLLKGSAAGTAMQYHLGFSCLLSSIRVALETDADRSRFSVLALEPHGDNIEHWNRLSDNLSRLDEEWGERLFARSCALVPTIIKSWHILREKLSLKVGSRYGQQVGMLLAGYYSLLSDEPIDGETAIEIIEEFWPNETEEHAASGGEEKKKKTDEAIIEAGEKDHFSCLNHLMNSIVMIQDADGKYLRKSIAEVLESGRPYELKKYGIKAEANETFFIVANNHPELEKIFLRTHWGKNWKNALIRLPNSEPTKPIAWNKYCVQRGIKIKSVI